MSKSDTVLVTGGTGHLGFNIVQQLTEKNYNVRAMVRDLNNKKRNAPLKELGVELVEADLLDYNSLNQALQDVHGVFQVAAVYKIKSEDSDAVVEPSVTGGLNVLKAALENQVDRVVWTSSMAAIGMGTSPDDPFTEDDWNHDAQNSYYYAKYKAERDAWEFAKEHGLDLITINPAIIVGPYVWRHTPSTQIFDELYRNAYPMLPPMKINVVDVRDVADLHVLAYEKTAAKGRYIAANDVMTLKEIADKLHEKFPSINSPRFVLPPFFFRLYARLSNKITVEESKVVLETAIYADSSKARTQLGWKTRPIDETLEDMIRWIQDTNIQDA